MDGHEMPDGPDPASGRKWKACSVLGDWASHSKTLDQIMDTNGGLEWTGRHGHDQVGHTGTFEYDPDPDLLAGHVIDLRDEIYFEGAVH